MELPLSERALRRAAELVRADVNASLDLAAIEPPPYFSPRNRVARIPLSDGSSVIVKERRANGEYSYDVFDTSPKAQPTRVAYEVASLSFLSTTAAAPNFPRLIGADYDVGVVVLEDLGEGQSLVDVLGGDNPAAADVGLRLYAAALGHNHASTAGRVADFAGELHLYGDRPAAPLGPLVDSELAAFKDVVAGQEAPLPPTAERELREVGQRLSDPGPYLTWTHGDACPGHERLSASTCKFIDLEFGAFRHALFDLAYLRVAFPSCGFVGRLPQSSVNAAESAYRLAASPGIPQLDDVDEFDRELAQVWAYWIAWSVNVLLPGTATDAVWGNATHQERLVQRLVDFGSSASSSLPALAAWASGFAIQLQARWPEVHGLPLFRAYASRPSDSVIISHGEAGAL